MKNDKKIYRKVGLYILRALILMGAGLLIEAGTSYFGDWAQNALPNYIMILLLLVVLAIYAAIASRMRPIRGIDNDLGIVASLFLGVLVGFVDNLNAGYLSKKVEVNLLLAIFFIILGIGCLAIDRLWLDKLYERYSEREKFCLSDVKGYNIKIIKAWIISSIATVIIVGAVVIWTVNTLVK